MSVVRVVSSHTLTLRRAHSPQATSVKVCLRCRGILSDDDDDIRAEDGIKVIRWKFCVNASEIFDSDSNCLDCMGQNAGEAITTTSVKTAESKRFGDGRSASFLFPAELSEQIKTSRLCDLGPPPRKALSAGSCREATSPWRS